VSRVVLPEALMPTARALAREIADHTSAISVALCRQMMWSSWAPTSHGGAPARLARHGLDGPLGGCARGHQRISREASRALPAQASQDMPPFYPWWTERSFK